MATKLPRVTVNLDPMVYSYIKVLAAKQEQSLSTTINNLLFSLMEIDKPVTKKTNDEF